MRRNNDCNEIFKTTAKRPKYCDDCKKEKEEIGREKIKAVNNYKKANNIPFKRGYNITYDEIKLMEEKNV